MRQDARMSVLPIDKRYRLAWINAVSTWRRRTFQPSSSRDQPDATSKCPFWPFGRIERNRFPRIKVAKPQPWCEAAAMRAARLYALLFFFVGLDLNHFDQICKSRIASAQVLATKL